MEVMNSQHDGHLQGSLVKRSAEDALKAEQLIRGVPNLNPPRSAHRVRGHKRGGQS
jgi:hypothetical protein